jgi:hypothetical protein
MNAGSQVYPCHLLDRANAVLATPASRWDESLEP